MDDYSEQQSAPSFRVWLCGTFRVERHVGSGYELVRVAEWGGSSYPRLLLKALLCSPGRQARREALLELLWPDADPEQATQSLNTAVTRLRKMLAPGKGQASVLITDEDSHVYRLAEQSLLWVDADAALLLLGEAERRGRTSPEALSLLEEAQTSLSKGMILQDEEGHWAAGRRATVEQARARARLWLAEAYEQHQMPGLAETTLSQLLEEDPTDEDVLARLMLLLHRQGMTQQALRVYERACEVAAREEVEFTEATRKLAVQLAAGDRRISTGDSLTSPSAPILRASQRHDPLLDRVNSEEGQVQAEWPSLERIMKSAITAEEFLLQCSSSIKACWHLLRGKELMLAEEVLSTILSPLVKLVIQPSKYQSMAARIVIEAYMMRAIIAKHQTNFTMREVSCYEAVKYSHLAEDSILHAAALMYLAYTYIFIPAPRPKRAAEIFLEALHVLRDTAPLLKSDICMGLADAYAQCKEERAACQYAQLAHAHFPLDPEYDPSHLYADCALDTVCQWEAKTYIDLAFYYPDQGYYQRARDMLEQSAQFPSLSERSTMETMMYQASVALGLGDLELFTTSLRKGTLIAVALGSRLRYRDAFEVYQRIPETWRNEREIQQVAEIFRLSTR